MEILGDVEKRLGLAVMRVRQLAVLELDDRGLAVDDERDAIADLIGGFRFTAGFGRPVPGLVRHGIGVHHAGMLPKYRRLVELLTQAGLLKVICGTDTLGVGINVPIRTVLFTGLSKYDGTRTRLPQGAGVPPDRRPGRPGRVRHRRHRGGAGAGPRGGERTALAKAGDDAKKRRKVVRKKPPEGSCRLGQADLRAADGRRAGAADLQLRGQPLHAAQRDRPARRRFAAMRHLLTDNHEARPAQRRHIRRAIADLPGSARRRRGRAARRPDAEGRTARLTVDLQPDFALNQPLSPFALAAFELLDRESPTYALDVLR